MSIFKKLADPAGLFNGGGEGTILDPLGLLGGKKGGGFLKDAMAQMLAAQQQEPAAPDTLMTPTVMPTADSDAQRAARRKSVADQAKRRGRQSTILSNDDPLGAAG